MGGMSGAHVVEARPADRTVRVEVDGEVVAESSRPVLLTETNLPDRWYLPREDVHADVLLSSETHTHCPYKGDASYHTLKTPAGVRADLVWYYPEPLDAVAEIRDHLSFYSEKDGVEVFVDGRPASG